MSDFPLSSPQQPLSWEQKQTGYDDGKTDNAGLTIDPALSFPWPEDPNERIWVPVYMSLNEYTALLSAVDVGAAIAWTDDALLVYYILVRCFSGGSMQFCQKVIDCLLNDDDVKQAIADDILADGPIREAVNEVARNGSSLTTSTTGTQIFSDCDKDVLFAGITSIVDTMNQNNKDFLEVMALAATQKERIANAISAIPVIGLLPIDEIVNYVAKMQAEILVNYDAEYTLDVRDEYRCGLFCIAIGKDDCSINYDDIFGYIQTRLGAALDPLNLLASLAEYTILGTWSGTSVVDIMMLNQIGIWKIAGKWLKSVIRTLETVAALGADTPDPDWNILCTDCPSEWCKRLDPDNGLQAAFTPSGGAGAQAQWQTVGWGANPSFPSRITIHGDMGVTVSITDIRIVLDAPVTVGEIQQIVIFTSGFGEALASGTSTDDDALYGVNTTLREFEIDVEAGTTTSGAAITSHIIAIEIHGTGTEPTITATTCE